MRQIFVVWLHVSQRRKSVSEKDQREEMKETSNYEGRMKEGLEERSKEERKKLKLKKICEKNNYFLKTQLEAKLI